jgi:hypothetical protein
MLIEYSHYKGPKTKYFIPWFMTSGSSPFAISHLTTEVRVNRVNLRPRTLPHQEHVQGKPLNPKPLTGAKKLLFAIPQGFRAKSSLFFFLSLSLSLKPSTQKGVGFCRIDVHIKSSKLRGIKNRKSFTISM